MRKNIYVWLQWILYYYITTLQKLFNRKKKVLITKYIDCKESWPIQRCEADPPHEWQYWSSDTAPQSSVHVITIKENTPHEWHCYWDSCIFLIPSRSHFPHHHHLTNWALVHSHFATIYRSYIVFFFFF